MPGCSQHDAVIIGAGAAGLFCAMRAAGRGRFVVVIDHESRPGRKILASGKGRCNFTNRSVQASDYPPKTRTSSNPRSRD